ncbi:MAG TPA: hypothetical protein VGJ59_08185 [Jatrophihabitantaceae bacterium]|jgi:hypothetical protein
MIRSQVRKTASAGATVTFCTGSCVVTHEGRHDGGVARPNRRIVADSASGQLAGLQRDVAAAAGDTTYQVTISYAFDNPALH